jgi:hypothetical protein
MFPALLGILMDVDNFVEINSAGVFLSIFTALPCTIKFCESLLLEIG